MAKSSTMNELMALSLPDLKREIKAQTLLVEKLRAGITLRKEKDTAQLKRERRQLARMHTEQTRKTSTALPASASASTVSASAPSASADRPVPSKP